VIIKKRDLDLLFVGILLSLFAQYFYEGFTDFFAPFFPEWASNWPRLYGLLVAVGVLLLIRYRMVVKSKD